MTNSHTGNILIDSSVITNNIGGSWYPTYPQISNHDDTPITVTNSTIQQAGRVAWRPVWGRPPRAGRR